MATEEVDGKSLLHDVGRLEMQLDERLGEARSKAKKMVVEARESRQERVNEMRKKAGADVKPQVDSIIKKAERQAQEILEEAKARSSGLTSSREGFQSAVEKVVEKLGA